MVGEAVVPVGEVVLLGAGVAVFPCLFECAYFKREFEREPVSVFPGTPEGDVSVLYLHFHILAVDTGFAGSGPLGIMDGEGEPPLAVNDILSFPCTCIIGDLLHFDLFSANGGFVGTLANYIYIYAILAGIVHVNG